MLNVLELEPWVTAERHSDGGALVVGLYGHPERTEAIRRIRRAFTGAKATGLRGTRGGGDRRGRGTVGGWGGVVLLVASIGINRRHRGR